MIRLFQIFSFVVLSIPLLTSACVRPNDKSSQGTETLTQKNDLTTGTVTGKICYPSESIPPMTLYFQSPVQDKVETIQIGTNQDTYVIDLEPGTYVAYAYPKDDYVIGGMYSRMVICGLSQDCKDHSLLTVKVKAGETTSGVDVCDWYAGPGLVPVPPGIPGPKVEDLLSGFGDGPINGESVLSAYLELPERRTRGEQINLKFTLMNASDTPLYVLTWYTPLEGIGGEIFRVTHGGREIPYEGILAYRSVPTPDAYVLLTPGMSVSAVVDLATAFDFSKAGEYTIEFLSPRISHLARTLADMAKTMDDLGPIQISSNAVTVEIVDS